MAKKIDGYIKLQVPAGKANPSPPIGPALGQRGLNIMEFCKSFNAATQEEDGAGDAAAGGHHGVLGPLLHLPDQVAARELLPQEGGRAREGHRDRGPRGVGKVTKAQLREIAEKKMADLNANDLEAASRMLAGTARSMGLEVVE